MYQILVSGTTIGLFLQVVPITVVLGAYYLILRLIYLQKKQIPIKWSLEIVRTLFICYLTGLANLILVPRNFWSGIWANIFVGYSGSEIELFDGTFNFTPIVFKIISGELTLGSWVKTMLAGNFLMFIPMGFFLPLAASKMDFKKILKIAIVSWLYVWRTICAEIFRERITLTKCSQFGIFWLANSSNRQVT